MRTPRTLVPTRQISLRVRIRPCCHDVHRYSDDIQHKPERRPRRYAISSRTADSRRLNNAPGICRLRTYRPCTHHTSSHVLPNSSSRASSHNQARLWPKCHSRPGDSAIWRRTVRNSGTPTFRTELWREFEISRPRILGAPSGAWTTRSSMLPWFPVGTGRVPDRKGLCHSRRMFQVARDGIRRRLELAI
jgi:hypothetical protein